MVEDMTEAEVEVCNGVFKKSIGQAGSVPKTYRMLEDMVEALELNGSARAREKALAFVLYVVMGAAFSAAVGKGQRR